MLLMVFTTLVYMYMKSRCQNWRPGLLFNSMIASSLQLFNVGNASYFSLAFTGTRNQF